ncbi:MAG: hypothetical protein M1834_007698 [Cirrosporium novae-zelandiae]|nr:MAG: hypothetical protein M1834_007698 [Cirrosporium novae-zelandiae]
MVATHQRFVFSDPIAFRYLEEDPSTTVIERQRRLEGYEIYCVEQWACSRIHPTFIITNYTGDPTHSIVVSILSIPTDEETWSPRLKVYFKALSQFHARRKETRLGILMVTNLSGFPSALTVIPVPDGDVKLHRQDFIVNEDLKRLGCSGRAGLNLQPPLPATVSKFHQLYRTSDRVPLYKAVTELVRLCQVALMIFAKLEPAYVDGLLCDVTERGINDWWTDVGTELYNIEPSDGILGPMTVSALLGMLMGARNRLNQYGAPVPKDAFDVIGLKRGISNFQRSQKIPKTRRLDRQTLDRLHRVTAKAASGEGWGVPKAVKSTVAELSGKGGEMVMSMVGVREKAGIADIETVDIERFVQLIHGETAKCLWYGKTRKYGTIDKLGDHGDLFFSGDDHRGYAWSTKKWGSEEDTLPTRQRLNEARPSTAIDPGALKTDVEDAAQEDNKPLTRSASAKPISGLGKIKDAAVGITGISRSHHHKQPKEDDEATEQRDSATGTNLLVSSSPSLEKAKSGILTTPEKGGQPKLSLDIQRIRSGMDAIFSMDPQPLSPDSEYDDTGLFRVGSYPQTPSPAAEAIQLTRAIHSIDSDDLMRDLTKDMGIFLRRTKSHSGTFPERVSGKHESWWPRHLSFSTIEDAVQSWRPLESDDFVDLADTDTLEILRKGKFLLDEARELGQKLLEAKRDVGGWAEQQVEDVERYDTQIGKDHEELETLYVQHVEDMDRLRELCELNEEKGTINEEIRHIENLEAKLEYELNALQSRVADAEDGIEEFRKQVSDVEKRVDDLCESGGKQKAGWTWMFWKKQQYSNKAD